MVNKLTKYIFAPFRFLYKIYFGICVVISIVPTFPLAIYYLKDKKKHSKAFRLKRLWCNTCCVLTGVFFKISGKTNIPDEPYIICANHSSYLDTIFMYKVSADHFKFIAKAEVEDWPFFGVFFKKGADISVHRENKEKAKEALALAALALKEGICIGMFPEGTIPRNAPQMKELKNGAFKLAIENNVPLLPVTFLDNWKRMGEPLSFTSKGSPGICRIIIHAPIFPTGLDMMDLAPLRDKTYEIINNPLREAGYSV